MFQNVFPKLWPKVSSVGTVNLQFFCWNDKFLEIRDSIGLKIGNCGDFIFRGDHEFFHEYNEQCLEFDFVEYD